MSKVIFLAGVPASGKSTIFKQIRNRIFANPTAFREGKVRGITSQDGKAHMLGVFDGSTFEGTDKLSMTVIGDAIAYCNALPNDHVVYVEGDRLFNARFLIETRALLFLIDAHEDVLAERHRQRGDCQTATFLQSRRTKVENFAKKYNVARLYNDTPDTSRMIVEQLVKFAL